jgi:hypothetical protein
MRFQVPQFTEIEDKIFGPLTFKQFIYLVGGGGGVFILYALLPIYLAILFGIPVGLFALALAFYRLNNQPFIKVVENAFHHATSSKLYLWKKKEEEKSPALAQSSKESGEMPMVMLKLTKGKLEDLAWSLDVKEKVNR